MLPSQAMWNDTDVPLAIFFTFRCYGTWLHGDERGSVDRHHNIYRTPTIKPNTEWKSYVQGELNHLPVTLDAKMRRSIENAIRETCEKRSWRLIAINIRTNHVHCVIAIGSYSPDRALAALKANGTRQMREDGCWPHEYSPWVDKGSKRRLWNERSVWEASDYTINRQG
jgi:REP element-mobilizing transposase RayT